MEDKKERCPNKAEFLYSWGGELIKGCKEHAKAMKAIGEAMGVPVEIKPLITGERCMHDNDLDKISYSSEELSSARKIINNMRIQNNLQALQDIVNRDDGITSISIIAGGQEIKFKKAKK